MRGWIDGTELTCSGRGVHNMLNTCNQPAIMVGSTELESTSKKPAEGCIFCTRGERRLRTLQQRQNLWQRVHGVVLPPLE